MYHKFYINRELSGLSKKIKHDSLLPLGKYIPEGIE